LGSWHGRSGVLGSWHGRSGVLGSCRAPGRASARVLISRRRLLAVTCGYLRLLVVTCLMLDEPCDALESACDALESACALSRSGAVRKGPWMEGQRNKARYLARPPPPPPAPSSLLLAFPGSQGQKRGALWGSRRANPILDALIRLKPRDHGRRVPQQFRQGCKSSLRRNGCGDAPPVRGSS